MEVLFYDGLKGFQGDAVFNVIFQSVPKADCSVCKIVRWAEDVSETSPFCACYERGCWRG